MGSAFCTFDWAANRLNRSKRQIHNYVKDGLLRRALDDGKVVLHREDVEQLAIDLMADAPAMNRKTFIQLLGRVRKIEDEMVVVRRILEIRNDPLRLSKSEAPALVEAARRSLGAGKWQVAEIEMWADIFDRLDEIALDSFAEATNETKPWAIFFNLCIEQMKQVYHDEKFHSDLVLQTLHKKLDEGRKKMRTTVMLWIESGRGQIPENLLKEMNSGKEDLLKRLSASKSS